MIMLAYPIAFAITWAFLAAIVHFFIRLEVNGRITPAGVFALAGITFYVFMKGWFMIYLYCGLLWLGGGFLLSAIDEEKHPIVVALSRTAFFITIGYLLGSKGNF